MEDMTASLLGHHAPEGPPNGCICTCDCKGDDEMEGVGQVLTRKRPGMRAIVRALGEMEETDHERTCLWYGLLLEMCERVGQGFKNYSLHNVRMFVEDGMAKQEEMESEEEL